MYAHWLQIHTPSTHSETHKLEASTFLVTHTYSIYVLQSQNYTKSPHCNVQLLTNFIKTQRRAFTGGEYRQHSPIDGGTRADQAEPLPAFGLDREGHVGVLRLLSDLVNLGSGADCWLRRVVRLNAAVDKRIIQHSIQCLGNCINGRNSR